MTILIISIERNGKLSLNRESFLIEKAFGIGYATRSDAIRKRYEELKIFARLPTNNE